MMSGLALRGYRARYHIIVSLVILEQLDQLGRLIFYEAR
jgi:hypothetical protein